MPKITLEPRKTTWVNFIDEKAKMEIERTCKVYYYKSNILNNANHYVEMRYKFSGMKGNKMIPSSQLIIKENGIPVTITNTQVSLEPNKFSSTQTQDPFVEVTDNVANYKKSKVKEKKLSKRVIERTWEEDVTRVIKVSNKTGRNIVLELKVFENPAENVAFVSASPKPTETCAPERIWKLEFKKEQDRSLTLKFKVRRLESLRLPPDKTRGGGEGLPNQPAAPMVQQMEAPYDDLPEEMEYYDEGEEEFLDEEDQSETLG